MLLNKLQYYGLQDATLNWFKSYLADRTQYVEYDGVASARKRIETGVPQGSILGPSLLVIYMNNIQTASERLNFILYADDMILTSTLCTFTQEVNHDVNHMSYLINLLLSKISDWLAVNKLSLNTDRTKFMIFHNHQKVISTHEIPCLVINKMGTERVNEFNFYGLTINEFMNWISYPSKIANKISRTLGIMNRLKRYLPLSAMKLMYDYLVLSHLQFRITCWGFERERILRLQKRALQIMMNSKYNAHTDPLFKDLEMLKVKVIFDVQCLKLWYKFINNELPHFFKSMFTYNHELYETETSCHGMLHLYPQYA